MQHQSAGRDLLIALGAGASGGVIFALGLYLLDIGSRATLLTDYREAINVAIMAAPLLALFAISALATLPSDLVSGKDGRLVRLPRPAAALATRRRRRPPRE